MLLHTAGTGAEIQPLTDADFARFRDLILEQTGIQLKEQKRNLLLARLGQPIRTLGFRSFSEYYEYVAGDPSGEALREFINRITTNKTYFFREPHHFEFMQKQMIPELRRTNRRELRIWSAGCSSGEEPYSIAIAAEEALGPHHGWKVRILASDIDTAVLAQARAGTYPITALDALSPALRRSCFLRGYGEFAGQAQIRPAFRKMIHFRRINFKEPHWGLAGRFDAIFCRNVIIYFDHALQSRIIRRMTERLEPGGYLFLGHSESLFEQRNLLTAVGPTIYQSHRGGSC